MMLIPLPAASLFGTAVAMAIWLFKHARWRRIEQKCNTVSAAWRASREEKKARREREFFLKRNYTNKHTIGNPESSSEHYIFYQQNKVKGHAQGVENFFEERRSKRKREKEKTRQIQLLQACMAVATELMAVVGFISLFIVCLTSEQGAWWLLFYPPLTRLVITTSRSYFPHWDWKLFCFVTDVLSLVTGMFSLWPVFLFFHTNNWTTCLILPLLSTKPVAIAVGILLCPYIDPISYGYSLIVWIWHQCIDSRKKLVGMKDAASVKMKNLLVRIFAADVEPFEEEKFKYKSLKKAVGMIVAAWVKMKNLLRPIFVADVEPFVEAKFKYHKPKKPSNPKARAKGKKRYGCLRRQRTGKWKRYIRSPRQWDNEAEAVLGHRVRKALKEKKRGNLK